jgi:glycine/D-amino acid oxidase-like deaminating enzyme
MAVVNKPTWVTAKIAKKYPKLTGNLETDVVIVGAGLAGLLSAYTLARAGKRVIVLETGRVANGATSYTTAFITEVIDTDASDMISIYGKNRAKLIRQSHYEAIKLIEQIVRAEKIDCEFIRVPNFSYINEKDEREDLEEEFKAVKQLNREAKLMRANDLKFPQAGYIRTPDQAKFHPLKFINGLVRALDKLDVQIFEQTEVEKLSGSKTITAKAGKHEVKAKYGIIATYDPLGNPVQTFAKKGMYVSYVYELRIPKGLFKEGIYEDFNNPYHYFRIDRQGSYDRMIIGGEDNRKEIEFNKQKNFNALKKYIAHILGSRKHKIVRKWSGYILEPSDGLALIGRYKDNQLVATAFSGNGMTYSAISAMIFRDIITGKLNKFIKIYDPKRTPAVKQLFKKGKDYVGELFGAAVVNTIKHS